jgi:CxxC motif-containing protein (DUF1111 family)
MSQNMKIKVLLFIAICFIAFISCEQYEPILPKSEEVLDGEVEGLTFAQRAQFLRGDQAFSEVFTSSTGLGPLFVTNSCISCHAGDGKGHPFTTLTRFGQSDNTGNQFLNMGGPQLQNRALPGYQPESLPNGATFSKFTPPAVTGLGFLQYVTDADILAMADPNDTNGDGISGVPHWITLKEFIVPASNAITQNGQYIHRFGKKAAAYDLLDQTVGAYNQDMGITSTFNLIDTYSGLSIDPEVSDNVVRDVVVYLETLKAPIPRDQDDPEVINGKTLFNRINCAACHMPTLSTGYSSIEALSYKEFNPYTDLLLHDMGSGLDDGYTEGNALSSEWRTPPLWGLGLSPSTQGGEYFLLHDGRAKSIEEAILLHGGEAENSKNQFQNLSESERASLIKFLESL